jgi:hypothetical protein
MHHAPTQQTAEGLMEFLNVLVAAAAGFAFGAIWYMVLSKPWVEAANIEVDENGRPTNDTPLPYIMALVAMILVAGMMRHVFGMGAITTVSKGLISGLGIGLFFISPWIMINNAYGGRPFKLTLIDSGYAVFGCGVIGVVLTLF